MPDKDPDDLITTALTPKAKNGRVELKDPPPAAMTMTADAAEQSALNMLDASDEARKKPRG